MPTFNPLSVPICHAPPERLRRSAWIEHIPFALALVDLARPRVLVELGTDTGVSYCAFCQAIAALSLSTRAYAVDTWEGDEHTGEYGPEILDDLRIHHDTRYAGFSRLMQMRFEEALPHFSDGSIDVLHIDGYHTYEAVRHDYETWLPKMSERGVVLFHDVNVREKDFGAWKFWEEVSGDRPAFAFHHGHGLGVLAVGNAPPEALAPFWEGEPEATPLRHFFYELGAMWTRHWRGIEQAQRHAEELHRQQATSAHLGHELEVAREVLADRLADLEACRTTVAEQQASLAELHDLRDRTADHERLIDALRRTLGDKESMLRHLFFRNWEAEQQLATHRQALEAAAVHLRRLEEINASLAADRERVPSGWAGRLSAAWDRVLHLSTGSAPGRAA